MNDQTQAKIMEWLANAADKISDFATQQVPPFVNEFLTWKFYENFFDIALFFIIVIPVIVFGMMPMIKFWKWGFKQLVEDMCPSFLAPVLITLVVISAFMVNFPYQQIKDCIEIKVAPKVYLIDYAAKIIKK